MMAALDKGDTADLLASRKKLKASLSPDDWDYMTWQE
jgi:hypothetical protein